MDDNVFDRPEVKHTRPVQLLFSQPGQQRLNSLSLGP
jgi:hypothetical protein